MENMVNSSGKEGKYLTFNLAGEEYGIGILKIKEIIGSSISRRVAAFRKRKAGSREAASDPFRVGSGTGLNVTKTIGIAHAFSPHKTR